MKDKKYIILLIVIVFVVFGTMTVFLWDLAKGNKMMDDKINQLRVGMKVEEVVMLFGDPDKKWGLELTHSIDVSRLHYQYNLRNGDILELVFYPDRGEQYRGEEELVSVIIHLSEGKPMTILDVSDPVGTVINVNMRKRIYSRVEPELFVAFDSSNITRDQINQIERGMLMPEIRDLFGEPDVIIDSEKYMYSLENNMSIVFNSFSGNQLDNAFLVNEQEEIIYWLFSVSDPQGTCIEYHNGSFSKKYPPFFFCCSEGDVIAQRINRVESGMNKEEVLDIFSSMDLEWQNDRNRMSLYIGEDHQIIFLFQTNLYRSYIMESIPGRKNTTLEIISDRDPIGTRIQYDPETGYFSKEYPADE